MQWTDLSLSALQYFVDTIDLKSLTLAAEKNNVSRPAVSQAIRRIEEVIGYEVLGHARNKVELTSAGRAFYQRAKASLRAFGQELTDESQAPRQLRLACTAALAEFFVLPGLKNVPVEGLSTTQIKIGTTAKVRQLIADGEASVGFLINDEKTFGFESTSLTQGKFVLRSKNGKYTEPLITTQPRPEVSALMKALQRSKTVVETHIEIESWPICKKTVETLGGTCLLPDLFPADSLKDIRNIKFNDSYEVLAIYKDKNNLSEPELELIETLKGSLKR